MPGFDDNEGVDRGDRKHEAIVLFSPVACQARVSLVVGHVDESVMAMRSLVECVLVGLAISVLGLRRCSRGASAQYHPDRGRRPGLGRRRLQRSHGMVDAEPGSAGERGAGTSSAATRRRWCAPPAGRRS